MALIDTIRNFAKKRSEKSSRFKEMQETAHLEKLLEERQKSANERELERIMEKRRQEAIKVELDKIRKKETKESWKGKNLFTGHKSILSEDKRIMDDGRHSLLKQKNIFTGEKQLFTDEENIFLDSRKKSKLNGKGKRRW